MPVERYIKKFMSKDKKKIKGMTFHIVLLFYQLISKANLTHQIWTGFDDRLVDLKDNVKNN